MRSASCKKNSFYPMNAFFRRSAFFEYGLTQQFKILTYTLNCICFFLPISFPTYQTCDPSFTHWLLQIGQPGGVNYISLLTAAYPTHWDNFKMLHKYVTIKSCSVGINSFQLITEVTQHWVCTRDHFGAPVAAGMGLDLHAPCSQVNSV